MMRGADLSELLGVAVMPMPQAVLLLMGRLPAAADDRVEVLSDGRIRITNRKWSAVATLAADPWRVTGLDEGRGDGWTVGITDHAASVPSQLKITKPGRKWAELELIRLEWHEANELPPRPDLPPCSAAP
jgi:hypothetical protein